MNTIGIWTEAGRLGGKPCIRGHRFTIAQLLGELADGRTLREISEDFDINYDNIKAAWIDLVNELCLLKINTKHIMSDQEVRGGQNCLQGHRIPISLTLMNLLVENRTSKSEAEDYELEESEITGMLWDLATMLNQEWVTTPEGIEKRGAT